MHVFLICFVPLFVAFDPIGNLPFFVGLTESFKPKEIRKIIIQSVITAAVVSFFFLILGKGVLKFLGISVADFMIAGGSLLFLISIKELLSFSDDSDNHNKHNFGIVPLGVPLMAGPAVLATSIILSNEHGLFITGIALISNIVVSGIIFLSSDYINRILGKTGSKIVSKVASLLLAGFSVMLIRRGFEIILK